MGGALEEAEGALEQEENKVLRASLELGQVRQEIDRRIAEKEEEFENSRKNHARAMDSMQASLESEQRAKLETRIRELEVELGNVQAHTGENSKGYQKSERRSKELAVQIEEDKKNQDRMSDLANKLQAKIKTYKKQIEEAEEIAALNL